MIRFEGSAIYCTQNELKLHLNGVDSLVSLGQLKKSDLLFWNTAYSIRLKAPADIGAFIPLNEVFDLLVGAPNPDIIKKSPLRYSRANRHVKIKNWEKTGVITLNKTPQSDLGVFTRGKIYDLQSPNLAQIESIEKTHVIRSKSVSSAELTYYESRSDIALIREIDKVYSFSFATRYLDIVLAPDPNFPKKSIEANIPIQYGDGFQNLKVSSSCFDDSRLMTPKDKIVAKYYQSAALQYMWQHPEKFLADDAANRFTFNLKDTLLSTGTTDSGSARWELYLSIHRVCSNKFELDGSDCPEFMKDADFIDENGNVMTRARYSHLTLIGETDEFGNADDEQKGSHTRKVPLYITLAIPDKLYIPTRKALILKAQNEDFSNVRPQLFRNDERLTFKEKTGYQDTLSDFLKAKVVYSNCMKTKLKRVLSQWLKANKAQPASGVFQFFRSIDDCMIYYTGKAKGARGQTRYDSCVGYFSEFVFECKITKEATKKQFAMADYEVVFHHVYPNQAVKIRKYIKSVNKNKKANPENYLDTMVYEDSEFMNWFQLTMTPEGMAEAKAKHNEEQKLNDLNIGLMIPPIAG